MEQGPALIRYLADKTPVRFHAYADFPDYQPYMPGAKPDGNFTRPRNNGALLPWLVILRHDASPDRAVNPCRR